MAKKVASNTPRNISKSASREARKGASSSVHPTTISPETKTFEGKLSGQVAVVTGGSRGIGLAIARALAAEGCTVVVTGRDDSALKRLARDLAGTVLTRHCDVRDPKSVARLFVALKKQFGKLDILVNNAGVAHPLQDVDRLPLEVWTEVVGTNLTGLFLTTRSAVALMARGATIVNNLSVSAKTVFPGMSAYNASKHGALGFTDSLREELRPRGIRVIGLVPGATSTEIWKQFWPDAPRERMMAPESIAEALLAAILLPQNTTVSELVITPTSGAL
ncbi:MAG TPA: SDR family oxidoreductase [Clostridia bacterium]|nr:SDR family oxidoreductase [Clostridia bacterium]